MEAFFAKSNFFKQHEPQNVGTKLSQSNSPFSDEFVKSFVPESLSKAAGSNSVPAFIHQQEVYGQGLNTKQSHIPQIQNYYKHSVKRRQPSTSTPSLFQPCENTTLEECCFPNTPIADVHFPSKESLKRKRSLEQGTFCSNRVDTFQGKAPYSELSSSPLSNYNMSSDVDADSNLMENLDTTSSDITSLTDVTSLAISAALNCGHNQAFPVELFPTRDKNESSIAGSRKNSHDSGYEPESVIGNININHHGSPSKEICTYPSSLQPLFTHSSSTMHSLNSSSLITTSSVSSSNYNPLGSFSSSSVRETNMNATTHLESHYSTMQDSHFDDIESLELHDSLDFSDFIQNANGISDSKCISQLWQQQQHHHQQQHEQQQRQQQQQQQQGFPSHNATTQNTNIHASSSTSNPVSSWFLQHKDLFSPPLPNPHHQNNNSIGHNQHLVGSPSLPNSYHQNNKNSGYHYQHLDKPGSFFTNQQDGYQRKTLNEQSTLPNRELENSAFQGNVQNSFFDIQVKTLNGQSTLPQRDLQDSSFPGNEHESFFDEFINVVCKAPSCDSGVAEPSVSPLAEQDDGREFQSSPGTEDSRSDLKESLEQFLRGDGAITEALQRGDYVDAKISPEMQTHIANICHVSGSQQSEDGFESSVTIMKSSDDVTSNTIKPTGLWSESAVLKGEDVTSDRANSSAASMHKILDPSWSPDSTTPMDVAAAVRHILQKRPESDIFPLARDIFDASYKILKASKLSSTLSKDVGLGPADVKPTSVLEHDQAARLGFPGVKRETVGFDPDTVASSNMAASSKKPCKKRPSVLPPCRVCGCPASGLHYGVVTCEACNGFFRRSLKRRAVYFCSKENKCDVTGKRRGECSFCRYHKCLAVGMSRTAVKTGRYSDKTRLAYALESENHSKGSYSVKQLVKQELNPLLISHVCNDMDMRDSHKVSSEEILCRDVVIDTSLGSSTETHKLSTSNGIRRPGIMSSFVEMWLCHFIKFVKKVPGFSLLHLTDQTTLVRSHWMEVWLLSSYRGRCEAEHWNLPSSSTDKAHYNEEKVVFGTQYADLSEKWHGRLKAADVTQTEMVLLMMVCLTSPDSCHLERKAQVSRLHWLMRQALSKHMDKIRVGDAHSFHEALSTALSVKSDVGHSLLAFDVRDIVDRADGQCAKDRPLLTEMLRDVKVKVGPGCGVTHSS